MIITTNFCKSLKKLSTDGSSLESMNKIGLFGGTFDPLHNGHIYAASQARFQLELDEVLLVVAPDPWQKATPVVASAETRFRMASDGLASVDGLSASRIELERKGPTYTFDTVTELRDQRREVVLILGSDAAAGLESWKRAAELRDSVEIAVIPRSGSKQSDLPKGWRMRWLQVPRLDVSSTNVRKSLAAGRPVDGLISESTQRVITTESLYGS